MIALGYNGQTVQEHCRRVDAVGVANHPYAMAEEHYTIFLCRGLKHPLYEVWPRWKHWN